MTGGRPPARTASRGGLARRPGRRRRDQHSEHSDTNPHTATAGQLAAGTVDGVEDLSQHQRDIPDFEARTFTGAGAKDQAALAHHPLLVNRLLQQRARSQRTRSARTPAHGSDLTLASGLTAAPQSPATTRREHVHDVAYATYRRRARASFAS